jgi:hypothetical protein
MRELNPVQKNGERLQVKYKDIKDLEAIEKKDFPVTKQVRIHSYSLQVEISEGQIIFRLDFSHNMSDDLLEICVSLLAKVKELDLFHKLQFLPAYIAEIL